jgi:hypothetical protein
MDGLRQEDILIKYIILHVIYLIYILDEDRPHLWSSGQSSWLQIQRSGFSPGATTFSGK